MTTKDRPILFSAPMVRALLDGSKTQTRRAMKPQPIGEVQIHVCGSPINSDGDLLICKHGQPGDRLWVREAWRVIDVADCFAPREITSASRIWFESDAPHQLGFGKYRPSMFMPRWASRITLEIVSVRVERLQDISEADAKAEGITSVVFRPDTGWPLCDGYMVGPDDGKTALETSAVKAYRNLWESINGPGSWDLNPWVWVIEFKKVTP